ncbi:MAG: hypothetical protein ACOCSF_05750, partial [Halanaeroarchaeum sp.]
SASLSPGCRASRVATGESAADDISRSSIRWATANYALSENLRNHRDSRRKPSALAAGRSEKTPNTLCP